MTIYACKTLQDLLKTKTKILSVITHPHVVSNHIRLKTILDRF